MLTYLATTGILFEAQWLLLTLLTRTLFHAFDSGAVFITGALALFVVWGVLWRHWTFPYVASSHSGRRDMPILIVLGIVLVASYFVMRVNGFFDQMWVTHGFFNGDTVTFISLIQKSLLTDGLVHDNPFAGNGSLEYPTLLHAGIATLLANFGVDTDWLRFLPLMTYAQILLTVPMFFLVWDMFKPEPKEQWQLWFGVRPRVVILLLQTLIVFYVMTLSWDNYIYPQSHFFLTGLFVLVAALFTQGYATRGSREWLLVGSASIIAFLVMLSNAVTGTAAVALCVLFYLLRSSDRKRAVGQRSLYALGIILWAMIFFFFVPGEPVLGLTPDFSYTAAGEMLRLSPVMIALFVAMILQLGKQPLLTLWFVGLAAVAYLVFIFSSRPIVIENASRFFYHALLVGFPLALGPLLQLLYWLRRVLMYTTYLPVERAAAWFGVLVVTGFFLLPAGASVASAHDNLMFKDEHIIDTSMRQALWWIEDNTSPASIFLASPYPPFSIPLFTGRSLLRADYWLSPDDVILEDVRTAFEDSLSSRETVLALADYLLLTREERQQWEPLLFEKVFDIGAVVIYKLK